METNGIIKARNEGKDMEMKYSYCLKDKNYKTFSITSDTKDIEEYLQYINGVYTKMAWVIQKNNFNGKIKEYLVHIKNGFITEYKKI